MENILLIDVDSKIPNLALMQISTYHKMKGDTVGFNISDPDKVYISCIYEKNRSQALGIEKMYPNSKVYVGGSGINYNWLPKKMQKIKPDYDLYPSTYSQGFTTRGCVRNCSFCIVRQKEGKFQRWQHIKDFYDPKFDIVMLMDNNIFADKEWFFENTDFIINHGLRIMEHGMDIRLLDEEIAQRVAELKFLKCMHFAFDNMGDEKAVRKGIELLKNVGIDLRRYVQFYVLVGYNTTKEQDIYRCRLLKELGTNAFVMPYVKNRWTSKIARWANRKWLYWSMDIEHYGVKN
jgi:hypothetical protein